MTSIVCKKSLKTKSKMKAKAPTLKVIAQELGLSISTVSRALRGMPEINPDTREAVLALSKSKAYKLHANHSSSVPKSNLLGAIIPCNDYYFYQIIEGMDHAALNAGYTLIVSNSSESYGREVSIIQRLLQANIDGFLISKPYETNTYEHYNRIIKANKPLIMIDRECKNLEVSQLLIDHFEGGYLAVKHLIERGYRKICFISGKPGDSKSKFTIENGITEALAEAKIENYDKRKFFGVFDTEKAFEKTTEILRMNDRPDAFFAANDQIAVGIYRAIEEAGYNIPKDIGVIGYNDEPFLSSFSPSISSVHVPGFELGKNAINLLISKLNLDQNVDPNVSTLKVKLSQRESTNQTKRFFGI
jgi:DNA-binding LacI/PurR family transcriptional regulator